MSGDITYSIRRRTVQTVVAAALSAARHGLIDFNGEQVELPISMPDAELEKAALELIAKVAGVNLEVV